MQQKPKLEELQRHIDGIVVLMTKILATRPLSDLERSDLEHAIRQLQEISRTLPMVTNRNSVLRALTTVIFRVLSLFPTQH
jgi:hypothetical protein